MKIYNKRSFAEGLLVLALGLLNLALDLINHTFEIKGAVLVIALCGIGVGLIVRATTLRFAKADRLDRQDERNQWVELKSKSKAFRLTQTLSFALMLGLLVAGKLAGNDMLIAIGVGLAFSFALSMFAEIFSFLYYEDKL